MRLFKTASHLIRRARVAPVTGADVPAPSVAVRAGLHQMIERSCRVAAIGGRTWQTDWNETSCPLGVLLNPGLGHRFHGSGPDADQLQEIIWDGARSRHRDRHIVARDDIGNYFA